MTAESWVKLVGFSIGAFLHVYLTYVIARQGLRGVRKWALFLLVTSLGIWHLGNAMRIFVSLLRVAGADRIERFFETAAYAGLALLPSALLFTYRIYLRDAGKPSAQTQSPLRPTDLLLFLPQIFLPLALWQLSTRPEPSAIARLREFVFPFIGLLAASMYLSAWMSRKMARHSAEEPERWLMVWLSHIFVVIGSGLVLIYLLRLREWPVVGGYLETAQMLSSIVPTSLVAYHIYRYNYLELVIRQSLVYALLMAFLLTSYFFGIRQLSGFLEMRYQLSSVFTESLLVSALVGISFPINGWINQFVTRRVRMYRDFVVNLNEQANTILDLQGRVEFIESAIRKTFDFRRVFVVVFRETTDANGAPVLDKRLLTKSAAPLDNSRVVQMVSLLPSLAGDVLRTLRPVAVEVSPLMRALGVNYGFPLKFEKRWVGLLLIDSHPLGDLGDVEDLLLALSGQIAGSIANGRLLDTKLRLEREIARQERLAHLGRMGATMAHEVKNPLSSIKTLVQLMREDSVLQESHGKDLNLINGEIDRLNRTVTQLLAFARPPPPVDGLERKLEQVYVQDLIGTAASVLSKGQPPGRVEFVVDVEEGLPPLATETALLQEILINLFLNAMQAAGQPCRIEVRCRTAASPKTDTAKGLVLEISDNGPGIPESIQPQIFDAFFTTKQRGSGLGLFVVKRNVEALGGTLSFQSPTCETGGTLFRIFLPMK